MGLHLGIIYYNQTIVDLHYNQKPNKVSCLWPSDVIFVRTERLPEHWKVLDVEVWDVKGVLVELLVFQA